MTTVPLRDRRDRGGDGAARITGLRIENAGGDPVIRCTSRLKFTIEYESIHPLGRPSFRIQISGEDQVRIYYLNSDDVGGFPESLPTRGSVTCITSPLNITPGRCYVAAAVRHGGMTADHILQAAMFDVEPDDFHGTGKLPDRARALCLIENRWTAND
jgi:lipopolysaccharide transport system ATP-binding protein